MNLPISLKSYGTPALTCRRQRIEGCGLLAKGDPQNAIALLRLALEAWRDTDVPYEAARVQVQLALGYRALGDEDSAVWELRAARRVFEELGAEPEIKRIEQLGPGRAGSQTHGLTPRELQVLRLLAAGLTNRAIAADLVLAEKTVDRHVTNIFAKVGVSSRAAATAFAYENRLLNQHLR